MTKEVSELAFRALLRAFPPSVRQRFGPDMVRLLRDHQGDAMEGSGGTTWLWLSAAWNVLVQGLAARLEQRSSQLRRPVRGGIARPSSAGKNGRGSGLRTGPSQVLQDLRVAVRCIRRSTTFTVPAVLTLALGIGANTAVFSVLNFVVLRPLPYETRDRLVHVSAVHPESAPHGGVLTGPEYLGHRELIDAFEATTAIYTYRPISFTLTGWGLPQRVSALPVSADYWDVYRVRPLLGRGFVRSEEIATAAVAVISHRLYSALSVDGEEILGRRIHLDDRPVEVIGVMPPDFRDAIGGDVDLWTPLDMESAASGENGNYLWEVARLRSGVSIGEAQAQLDAYHEALDKSEWSEYQRQYTTRVVPLRSYVVGDVSRALYLLLGAAGLVLLIACLNVANLFLARNVARERELAVRTALGSGRLRLVQLLLVESGVVAVLGGGAGSLLAYLGVDALLTLAPNVLPRIHSLSPDGRLLLFALGVTAFTAILFGLLPTLRLSDPNPGNTLRVSSRGASTGVRGGIVRDALVVSQVALALLLLVGTGLLLHSMERMHRLDLGFAPMNATTLKFHLPRPRYDESSSRVQIHQVFLDRMESIPGVVAAGAVSWLPVSGGYQNWGHGYVDAEGNDAWGRAEYRVVEGSYFEAMHIPLIRGRLFHRTDNAETQPVALINEEMERRYYRDVDPLGQEIPKVASWRIVGVVRDVAQDRRGTVAPQVYLPHAQAALLRRWDLTQVVATATPRNDIVDIARRELAELDPNLVVSDVRRMDDIIAGALAQDAFAVLLMGIFAGVAALVACAGIYGTLSYRVSQRTRELGIRIALGAMADNLRWQVLWKTGRLVGAGLLLGLMSALALGRLLASALFEVSAYDPLVFCATPLAFAVVALAAGWLPAQRATTINPVTALGSE